ncbi:hypothetical protein AVEN_218853-1 [Araneus ventricosus]|uniref:Uncharacterized protein n=1 Tax=Araneus ventricosus TaxID=182803 RepID=A0A4Y2HRU1_ARAVE|nr:hypothetical protein AVEN_218853-1 [Araneus ventricosus]
MYNPKRRRGLSPKLQQNWEGPYIVAKKLNDVVNREKEEHLLPPPYQTDCSYNGPSKDDKDSTNPNSYEMCLDLCRSEFYIAKYGCDGEMSMVSSVRDLCFGYGTEDWVQMRIQSTPDFVIPSPHVDEPCDDGGTRFVLKSKMVVCLLELT